MISPRTMTARGDRRRVENLLNKPSRPVVFSSEESMNDKNKNAFAAVLMFGAIGCGSVWYGWGGFAVTVVAVIAGTILGGE